MAGTLQISSIQLDSDNNFSIISNTGVTYVTANNSGLLGSSIANTSITDDKLASPVIHPLLFTGS